MAYLNNDGLEYLLGKIKGEIDKKVEKEVGKGLSQEDFTTALKSKLENDVVTETDLKDYIKNTDIASENDFGIIKIGSGLTIDQDGKVNVTGGITEIPIASDTTLGGIKVGDNLEITEDGTLSAVGGISDIPVATDETLGGIIVGDGLSVDENGKLDVIGGSGSIPLASDEIRGGIKIGEGVKIDKGTEKLSIDTNVTKYLVPITKAEYENIPDKENDTEHEYIIVDDDEYVNVSADFLTEVGYGKLRFYQGKFQYLNTIRNEWIDISMDGNNPYIINMIPQAMKSFKVKFSYNDGKKFALKWEEPDDTIIEGQVACLIDKVVIRRKKGSVPLDIEDGIDVTTITRANFGMYKNNYFIDNTFVPNSGETWYYKAFPVSSIGYINTSTTNEGYATSRDGIVYGFHINGNESNPSTSVTYLEDAEGMTPCRMGNTEFNYGSWENAFFMPRPCMLNFDGTVAYYLNPNDYTQKSDGSPSDISNLDFEGNAMMEWGQNGNKIWYKIVPDANDVFSANIYISNKQTDEQYVAYPFINKNGEYVEHFYTSIYECTLYQNKIRSMSGCSGNTSPCTMNDEMIYSKNNGNGWNMALFSDTELINILLILMSKNLNTQSFGLGSQNNQYFSTGELDKNGLFWGTISSPYPVKVFGMENWWGNHQRRTLGYFKTSWNEIYIKKCYGLSDGSSAIDYNLTSNGYIPTGLYVTGKSGGFISGMNFSKKSFIPTNLYGSVTTYYCDGCWYDSNDLCPAYFGGDIAWTGSVGAFFLNIVSPITTNGIYITTGLSYK